MKNKKALSTIVITLIIVLLSLIAITILSIVVWGIIEQHAETAEIQNRFFGENIDLMSVNTYYPFVNITLTRQTGEIKATEINRTTTTETTSSEVDIISVVDLSGSMISCFGITQSCCTSIGGNYGGGSCFSLPITSQAGCISCGGTWEDKLTPLKDANKNMINTLLVEEGNRLSLVGYRSNVINPASAALTNNISFLTTRIDSWTATSNTCICCGINNASDTLLAQSSSDKSKAIIVMSDGEANVRCSRQGTGDAKQDAIHAACDANGTLSNIAIWSIGVGDADTATLTSIAQCGGGSYFSVLNASELTQIYQAIAEEIQFMYQSAESLNYLAIVFYNATDSYKETLYNIPEILQTKTYNFNLQGLLSGTIIKIEVYPIIVSKSKNEVTGPLLSSWTAD
jgi:Mg-chelatase subunit ChlD